MLNAGSGSRASHQLHRLFRTEAWREMRIDIDAAMDPDFVGSFTDMSGSVETATFDAVWSSHSLEHLYPHDVVTALAEFHRVLKPTGFVLIRCPDLETAASLLVTHGPDFVAYVSPMGPITPLQMVFGHTASLAQGRLAMAHRTGFTGASLARLLLDAGFATVLVKREYFDLWAAGFLPDADSKQIQSDLAAAGLAFTNQDKDDTRAVGDAGRSSNG
ncbi:MAG: methyltransferase domain-containing protein [Methylacidiphilales bacterium]|nr:methyltransferase domain-containing protein [Candidatus Methylacidiphilales bacterium]